MKVISINAFKNMAKQILKVSDKIKDFIFYLENKGLDPRTLKEHKRFITEFPKFILEKNIKEFNVVDTACLIGIGKKHGDHGALRLMLTFRMYLKFLHESGIKLNFHWRDIELPKVHYKEQAVFTEKEVYMILDKLPIIDKRTKGLSAEIEKRNSWTLKALLETLFATGMRIHECLSLRRNDFETIKEKKELVIKKTKTGDERIVYFSDRAIEWLGKYLERRYDRSEAMFVNSYGFELLIVTAKNILYSFRKEFGEFGKKIKFHTFRRTLASLLFDKGVNLKAVQTILGHADSETTLKHYIIFDKKRAGDIYRQQMNVSEQ